MRDFERRIADLERRAGMNDANRISVIVRTFWKPAASGAVHRPVSAYRTPDRAWRIEREAGESEEDFHDRTIKLAPRKPGAITVLREELA